MTLGGRPRSDLVRRPMFRRRSAPAVLVTHECAVLGGGEKLCDHNALRSVRFAPHAGKCSQGINRLPFLERSAVFQLVAIETDTEYLFAAEAFRHRKVVVLMPSGDWIAAVQARVGLSALAHWDTASGSRKPSASFTVLGCHFAPLTDGIPRSFRRLAISRMEPVSWATS